MRRSTSTCGAESSDPTVHAPATVTRHSELTLVSSQKIILYVVPVTLGYVRTLQSPPTPVFTVHVFSHSSRTASPTTVDLDAGASPRNAMRQVTTRTTCMDGIATGMQQTHWRRLDPRTKRKYGDPTTLPACARSVRAWRESSSSSLRTTAFTTRGPPLCARACQPPWLPNLGRSVVTSSLVERLCARNIIR